MISLPSNKWWDRWDTRPAVRMLYVDGHVQWTYGSPSVAFQLVERQWYNSLFIEDGTIPLSGPIYINPKSEPSTPPRGLSSDSTIWVSICCFLIISSSDAQIYIIVMYFPWYPCFRAPEGSFHLPFVEIWALLDPWKSTQAWIPSSLRRLLHQRLMRVRGILTSTISRINTEAVVNYYDTLPDRRVVSNVEPGYLKKLLPSGPPQKGEAWTEIQKDIETKIMPGLTHWYAP